MIYGKSNKETNININIYENISSELYIISILKSKQNQQNR